MFDQLQIQNLHFLYGSMTEPIVCGLNVTFARGWTGIVGSNGSGKSTILRLLAGELVPERGVIRGGGRTALCVQCTDHPPARLADLLEDQSGAARRMRAELGVHECALARWPVLSAGEQKRAQIAVALWEEPDILLLDEPTNHLDSSARDLLCAALRRFRGVGVLVSHDRVLLDMLCKQCVFLEGRGAIVRPGNITAGLFQRDQEQRANLERLETLERESSRLKRELQRRRETAARAERKNSKRGLAKKDFDSKNRVDLARFTGKDAAQNRVIRQLERRATRASAESGAIEVERRYTIGVQFTEPMGGAATIAVIPAGQIEISADRRISFPALRIARGSRIGVSGNNGTGKTTLVRHIWSRSAAQSRGAFYLPQELSEPDAAEVLRRISSIEPSVRGRLLSAVRRLGSDPARICSTRKLSPGEARKLLIAEAISTGAPLLILDEPTNHFDLDAIQCLEQALEDYHGALIVVSHDERLLGVTTRERWCIGGDGILLT